MNEYNFENRVAVVTGGAQGFGFAISKRMIESGGKVIIWDIDENAIEVAKNEIKSENFNHQIVNVTDFDQIKESISELEKDYGKIEKYPR